MRRPALLALSLTFVSWDALAIELDDPVNFSVVATWSAASLGVPGNPGGLTFSEDGQTLYIVGDSERAQSAVYALPVIRDPQTQRVVGFGPAVVEFAGDPNIPGLDAGLERGPGNTLFYTYWNANHLGQRAVATSTVEVLFDMGLSGVPSSVAGLTFSPHLIDPGTGHGRLQVSSWPGNGIYDIPLTPLGGEIYEPGPAELFVGLGQQGTGAIQYVPQGLYAGHLMYVNWNFGEVRLLLIDPATGLPIDDTTGLPTRGTTTPRDLRFAYDLGEGPWGLAFDPATLDFFVTTWEGEPLDSIIQFSGPGFANQPPEAHDQAVATERDLAVPITLTATDPDLDPLAFTVVAGPDHGTLTGTPPQLVYQPNPGFVGMDQLTFTASDGQHTSNTATVTITVGDVVKPDAGMEPDSGVEVDAGAPADAGTADSGTPPPDAALHPDAAPSDAAATDAAEPSDAGARADAASAPDAAPAPDAGTPAPGEEDGDGCGCTATERGSRSGGLLLALLLALPITRRSWRR